MLSGRRSGLKSSRVEASHHLKQGSRLTQREGGSGSDVVDVIISEVPFRTLPTLPTSRDDGDTPSISNRFVGSPQMV